MLEHLRKTVADSLRLVSAIGVGEALPPLQIAKKVAGALADRIHPAEALRDFGHAESAPVDFGEKSPSAVRGAEGLAAAVSAEVARTQGAAKLGAPKLLDMEAGQLRAEIDAGGEYLIVDVREPAETLHGIVPSAWLIPMGQVFERITEFREQEKPIVIYCASGNRSRQVAQALRDRGLERTFNLKGGMQAWHSAGGEVDAGPGAPHGHA